MPITRKPEPVDLQPLLDQYLADSSPENYAALVQAYETQPNYKRGCGPCAASLRLFTNSVKKLASGDAAGVNGVVQSLRGAALINVQKLRNLFNGGA